MAGKTEKRNGKGKNNDNGNNDDESRPSVTPHAHRQQHHCPVCKKLVSNRCVKLEHVVECDIHHRLYNPRSGCTACNEADRRADRADRADREAQKKADEKAKKEAEEKAQGSQGRKKPKSGKKR